MSGSSGPGVKSSWCNELLLALLGFGWIVFLTIGSVRVVVGGGAGVDLNLLEVFLDLCPSIKSPGLAKTYGKLFYVDLADGNSYWKKFFHFSQ